MIQIFLLETFQYLCRTLLSLFLYFLKTADKLKFEDVFHQFLLVVFPVVSTLSSQLLESSSLFSIFIEIYYILNKQFLYCFVPNLIMLRSSSSVILLQLLPSITVAKITLHLSFSHTKIVKVCHLLSIILPTRKTI